MELVNVVKKLESYGYIVHVFENKSQAKEYLLNNIKGKTIGFGGSQTIEDLNLKNELSKYNTLYLTEKIPEGETRDSMNEKIMKADCYMLSANAMSENGEIVNIDGTGNRLAGSLFGHKKVYYVIGINKIGGSLDEAIDRARNIAGPKNALRLHRQTPCALKAKDELERKFKDIYKTDDIDQAKWAEFIEKLPEEELNTKCYDCSSLDRICRSLSVHLTRPRSMEAEAIIIKENIGY